MVAQALVICTRVLENISTAVNFSCTFVVVAKEAFDPAPPASAEERVHDTEHTLPVVALVVRKQYVAFELCVCAGFKLANELPKPRERTF